MSSSDIRRSGDDPSSSPTLAFAILGAILLFVLIVALQAFYYHMQDKEDYRKQVVPAPEEISRLRAEQLEQLNGYRYVDAQKGIVAIPIDRAIKLTVRDMNASSESGKMEEQRR